MAVKTFGKVVGLDGVDIDLFPGEVLAIIGDNRPRLYWSMLAAQCLGGVPVHALPPVTPGRLAEAGSALPLDEWLRQTPSR